MKSMSGEVSEDLRSSSSAMRRQLQRIAGMFLLAAATLGAGERRVHLLPKLHPGQTITYLIRFQSDKTVKTESNVVAPMAPNAAQIDAHGLLRVEILDAQEMGSKAAIHARGQFLTLDSGVRLKAPGDKKSDGDKQRVDPDGKSIEFTISSDGSVNSVKGLDSLFPEQQQAWQLSITGDVSASSGHTDNCAVLLSTATLKQKSSSKDATPEDFKLHELRTMGTAKGAGEIITYVSLKSGLVVRASEETSQFMDVVVAKADDSNRVHYNVDAKSHSEVLLVTETPLKQP